jgi:serine phosphatase RsbU (regulator of sigma subunit)
VNLERLRVLLGPLASASRARCVLRGPDGRPVFATDPGASDCSVRLDDPGGAVCSSHECPFERRPYLAPVREGNVAMGEFFWCAAGHEADRRALSDALAGVVAQAVGGIVDEALPAEVNRLRHELEIARTMQEALLPDTIPEIDGLEIAASLRPASNVGGDYYDIVPLGGGYLGLAIADVAGHGVSSAMMMTSFRMALLTELSREFSPGAVLRRINTLLYRDCDRARMFVTGVLAVYEPLTGIVQYANAGHNPPRLRKAGRREVMRLPATGVPLGMFEDVDYTESSITLEAGDTLVLYTDGLVENRNAAGLALGETGLNRAIVLGEGKGARDLLDWLLTISEQQLEGADRRDDVTVVVVSRNS